ncbi:alpha/beta-hydrolase [Gonapodya prolifera JEL478]|uniref:Alpha/beta-hydrolase n=1 Tax=Gonapodya prolifera (strain JEL478) TaxID=1344416 RepID=A0A139AIR1_GONPJ|nr:alpha/beta-hydrolase [Gonapodya prolifera JEL478]|eukprot:KXS16628.1 alpha/beta-hydrolase [Gonapodya prolifera JEL478]
MQSKTKSRKLAPHPTGRTVRSLRFPISGTSALRRFTPPEVFLIMIRNSAECPPQRSESEGSAPAHVTGTDGHAIQQDSKLCTLSHSTLRRVSRILYPSHRATLVCIDVPGHGLSDHRHRQVEYSDWRCVADVEAVREQLGWGRFHGVGHSMGCQILSMYAGTYPTRLHTLSLIDSVGPWSFPDVLHPPLLAEYVRDTKRAGAKRKPLYPTVHDALVARSKGSRIPLTYEGARVLCTRGLMEVELSGEGGDPGPVVETGPKYVMKTGGEKELTEGGQKRRGSVGKRATASTDDGDEEEEEDEEDGGEQAADGKFEKKVWYTWRTDPSLILSSGIRPSESVSVEFLKRIKCPTLVVLATEGYFVPTLQREGEDAEKQRLQTRLRGLRGGAARVVIMEGSHHLHLESRFRECGELVADFLEDHAGARARLGASGDEVAAGKIEEWVEGAVARL